MADREQDILVDNKICSRECCSLTCEDRKQYYSWNEQTSIDWWRWGGNICLALAGGPWHQNSAPGSFTPALPSSQYIMSPALYSYNLVWSSENQATLKKFSQVRSSEW